jgi:hypothetical protein
MRQKTKNHQNQGSIDKKFDFFPQSLSHLPIWVHLVQKTRAKNSHAWAPLKVPKCEILDRSDFHYFYTIKPFWVDDFVVKILTYYFNFWGSQASFIF